MRLTYDDVADTPDKCRLFLEGAGFEIVAVRTEFANSSAIGFSKAIAFRDNHLNYPAWQALDQAQPATRGAIRSAYIGRVTAAAVAGYVPNDTALNFVSGRGPA